MKTYENKNRRINLICNEFIETINKDYEKIKDQQEDISGLPNIVGTVAARIADVRESFIVKKANHEDWLPDIYGDNEDLLLSASVGQLRYPIKTIFTKDGEGVSADAARESLALSIQQLENEATTQLKEILRDWKELLTLLITV